ncbi:succinate-semialdehyde dehydrogenase/glutarate-semialdehyde dehydrogenase [Prauserella sediminis]|uniref:Succinate-semialdehyde dehydrogenase/glutarate-semialdehyde dehydrogenase n=1 Tax=Prauserella sediminis TaxID=577680 RepID=A0A839XT10_9PSEU|nr:NAD-dependent succinate-semialdehyde dehydrogenase [Prauserella sediminis]MBB3664564.1 succinate-semialdehyde dehydrogenase/glutarate-semialdehyde dehydrogenase [Prauserella sediminis]
MNATESDLLGRIPTELFVAGKWLPGSGGTFPVHDPATGVVLAQVADAAPSDGAAALDAAVGAGRDWARTAPRRRAEILRRAFDLVQEHAEDLALLMTLEMGKPLQEARGEVGYGGEFLRWFSEEAVRIDGRYGASPEGNGQMVVTHRPVGPSLLITPWNFPLAMATRKIAPALAAGCTVVVKPPALTPLTTLMLTRLLEQAGVPEGVVNVVTTTKSGAVCGPLISDPRLRKLSFTGSTEVGVRLLEQAAGGVLRTSMELGGNAPFLVFEDADLDAAVDGALAAKFRNIGQACTAANRFYVHETIAEEFSRRVTERVAAMKTGRGTDDGVDIGPLIEPKAVDGVAALVDDAVDRGARVRTGGARGEGPGTFYLPTVLTDVPPDAEVMRQEIFGPVLPIATFASEGEAIELANSTPYGLVGYAYARDTRRGQRLIEEIETGMMGLNVGVVSNAAAPFGGVKQSGLGREGAREGILEYLETKYTLMPSPYA